MERKEGMDGEENGGEGTYIEEGKGREEERGGG